MTNTYMRVIYVCSVQAIAACIVLASIAPDADAAILTQTESNTFSIDETTVGGGTGFGVSKFYMPGTTLLDVSLSIDASVDFQYTRSYSTNQFEVSIISPFPGSLERYNTETLTIDDPHGTLFDPLALSHTATSACTPSLSGPLVQPGTHWNLNCAVTGSKTFTGESVSITGSVPGDFSGLDIINFSAESSSDTGIGSFSFDLPPLTLQSESREFAWNGSYTLTYTYDDNTGPVVPIPAAVWLFSSGLAIMGIFGRRRS